MVKLLEKEGERQLKKLEKMKDLITAYLNQHKNVEFNILDLENYIIDRYDSLNDYQDDGGYDLFYTIINELSSSLKIKPMKSHIKKTNNRKTPLPIRWRIIRTKAISKWTQEQIFQVSDRLDISYFVTNPEKQNVSTWENILSIYNFLGEKDKWEWESKASRSYQLFEDEKFLNEEGRHLLGRLKLTEHDLKIENYGEPFSYFVHPRVSSFTEIKRILIIENLSFFHACRRLFRMYKPIVGLELDMIIYAEGTHIESSIKYIKDILEHSDFHFLYVGDMDPSGYSIYARLKIKNPEFDITLAKQIYYKMVEECHCPTTIKKDQQKNNDHFNYFLDEMGRDNEDFTVIAYQIWNEDKRIPQEVLPIDLLLKGEGNHA